MSNLQESPLNAVFSSADIRLREVVRNVYLETVAYIHAQVPEFTVNNSRIAEIDSMVVSNHWNKRNQMWPSHINQVYGQRDLVFVNEVALYKGVPVSIHVDTTQVWCKFPTITMNGHAINSYTLRTWKRSYNTAGENLVRQIEISNGERCWVKYMEQARRQENTHTVAPPQPRDAVAHALLKPWEADTYIANRFPTQAEVLSETEWYWQRNKNELNVFQLNLDPSINLPDQIEKPYNKYLAGLKREKTFKDTSLARIYKQYIAYRGKPLMAQHMIKQTATKPI